MRFEIRSGGVVAIVVGIAALSGAVFVLGLLAGYDVGRESQINLAQVTTAYPVPSAPADEASPKVPAVATSPAAVSAPPSAEAASRVPAAGAGTPPARLPQRAVASVSTPVTAAPSRGPRQRMSATDVPPSAPAKARQTVESNDENSEEDFDETPSAESSPAGEASAASRERTASIQPPAAAPRHKPYNIQIEAAMDINGADAMMRRLQRIGYQPHLVPTRIGDRTWFKVEVGPYATAREAQQAQAQLRQRYAAAYGAHSGNATGGSAARNSGTDDPQNGDEQISN